jgi:GNAT superfamily N-acetyltransferase
VALTISLGPAADAMALRSAVLRDGRPHEGFAEDDWPDTFHVLARDDEGRVVGVATFLPVDGWQLRGMAVDPSVQGQGIGRALLARAVDELRSRGATSAWANGRDTALAFYQRLGWRVVGAGFRAHDLPHHRIELDL